jgi:hypothetical protein
MKTAATEAGPNKALQLAATRVRLSEFYASSRLSPQLTLVVRRPELGGRNVLLADIGDGLFRGFQYVALGLLMLGLLVGCGLMFLLGVVLALRAAVLTRYGVRVEGRVVEHPNTGDEIFDTIVEFIDIQGNTQRKKLLVSSSDDPPVGQSMCLVYNPSDPNEVYAASFGGLWMCPLICCVGGGLAVLGVLGGILQRIGVLPLN